MHYNLFPLHPALMNLERLRKWHVCCLLDYVSRFPFCRFRMRIMNTYMRICMYTSLSLSLSIFLSIHISLSLYIYIYTLSLYIYIYVYIYIYIHTYIYIYIYIHMYVLRAALRVAPLQNVRRELEEVHLAVASGLRSYVYIYI